MNLKDRFGLGSTWLICISLFVYSGLKQMTPRPGITTYALMHLLYLFQSPAWREKTYHKKYTKRAKKISCHSVQQLIRQTKILQSFQKLSQFFFQPPCENCCEQAENLSQFHTNPSVPFFSMFQSERFMNSARIFFSRSDASSTFFLDVQRKWRKIGWLVGGAQKNHFIELLLHYEKSLHQSS